jgi:YqaJ-like viral recombinase domain
MFEQLKDWQLQRLGKFTASEIHRLIGGGTRPMSKDELEARPKDENGKLLSTRTTLDTFFGTKQLLYIREKAAEILTQEPNNGGRANTYAMEWGNSNEHDAVLRYEKETGNKTEYFGGSNPKFFDYSKFTGGSPDGLQNTDTVIEVKCPFNSAVHIEHYMFNDVAEFKDYSPAYYWQIVSNILFTNRAKGVFISYDPRFADDELQIKILEFMPIDGDIDILKEVIKEAEKELQVLIAFIRNDFN